MRPKSDSQFLQIREVSEVHHSVKYHHLASFVSFTRVDCPKTEWRFNACCQMSGIQRANNECVVVGFVLHRGDVGTERTPIVRLSRHTNHLGRNAFSIPIYRPTPLRHLRKYRLVPRIPHRRRPIRPHLRLRNPAFPLPALSNPPHRPERAGSEDVGLEALELGALLSESDHVVFGGEGAL